MSGALFPSDQACLLSLVVSLSGSPRRRARAAESPATSSGAQGGYSHQSSPRVASCASMSCRGGARGGRRDQAPIN